MKESKHSSQYYLKLLLDREYKSIFNKDTQNIIQNKVVLVTGAGGSIGSEICRQLIKYNPSKIILVGHGENSIYQIHKELVGKTHIELEPRIVEIQNANRVNQLLKDSRPQLVFHAAAHKHVPLMEKNPYSAIENNVIGTLNLAEASGQVGVDHFIFISTDKAVEPNNVMGATKKIAEKVIFHCNQKYTTKYGTVRFGNVLASRGSVIPLFVEQILAGEPVTVTDPNMTRYFMSIEEAASLVIESNRFLSGGEVFILNMGDSVKIIQIAERLIQTFAKTNVPITYTGIRNGEKTEENLLEQSERLSLRMRDNLMISDTTPLDFEIIKKLICSYEDLEKDLLLEYLLGITNEANMVEDGEFV
ncbi:polysaccharide biosynthesis protein [Listeria booriae]|uniref:Polysaccharide biosynthesis protein n=1 Tax=Listeria booriae TaxID=1552123 RepID=A0A842B2G0_9LIST|nr:SDR family NAD(P)-dependent oxidoreductase [Listeria booriae]MBC1796867.1 polysaccharide biosynthesis protein [Listeria booriae]